MLLGSRACEQGLARIHANRIKKQLVLCPLNTIFYLICTLSRMSTQAPVSPPESMLEINDWKNKPQHLGWINRSTPGSISDQLLRQNTFKCTKSGKGNFIGAKLDGSWLMEELLSECVSLVMLLVVRTGWLTH